MDGKKVYTIVINNITETVDAVKSLNEQLNILEGKINSLQNKTINVTTNATTTNATTNTGDRTSTLKEEDSLLKQIEQTEQKIAQTRSEGYQELLHQKDILKDVKKESAARFAEDNLALKEYDNTMQGIKDRLADLKKAMQIQDIDSDAFKKMAAEANELNNKLKQAEQSYGVFSRDVGNYSNSIQDALGNITLNVGGVDRTFSSAKEASRELGNELKTMAVNGKQGTKEFKDLQKVVAQLNSSIKDATVSSKGMDAMLDTIQGIVAIASTAKGLGALFGMDNNAIEQSIQKLVALQNVMKGIEEIRQQMNTGEGIGGWIAKGNEAVDNLVESLLGANKAQEALNTATTAGKTASQGLAAAETAQAAATTTATVATKALSMALKAIGIGLVITAVSTLITYWEDIYGWFTDTIPALKNLSTWFDKIRAVVSGVGTAIINHFIQPLATVGKVVKALIEGNFSDIPKIISEGFVKTFNVVGNFQKGYYKETERQQKVHNEKMRQEQMEANEEAEKDAEAKYGKDYKRTQEYLKKQLALVKKGSKEEKELQRKLWQSEREEREANNKKNAASNKKALDEQKKQMEEAQKVINTLQMRLMDDGLNKRLMQLDEEKRQTLNKLNQNSQAYIEVEKMYEKLRLKEIKTFLKDMEKAIKESARRINETKININIKEYEQSIKDVEETIRKMSEDNAPVNRTLVSKYEYDVLTNGVSKENLDLANEFDFLREEKKVGKQIDEYYRWLENYFSKQNQEFRDNFSHINLDTGLLTVDYDELESYLEDHLSKELDIINSFGIFDDASLSNSFNLRLQSVKEYDKEYLAEIQNSLDEEQRLRKEAALEQWNLADQTAEANTEALKDELKKRRDELISGQTKIYLKYRGDLSKMTESEETYYNSATTQLDALNKQLEEANENRIRQLQQNEKDYYQSITNVDVEIYEKRTQISEKYYNTQLSNYRDFLSKLSDEASKQPVYDKAGFGIINLSATKKNYKEILDATKFTLENIRIEKENLNRDFKQGIIDPESYNATLNELTDIEKSTKETAAVVGEDLKNLGTEFYKGINQWLQQIGQAMGSILGSLSEIESNRYDKEIDKQEKYIDKLQKLYDKQQDITQSYADAVNGIEDELSTARGDRRQQLIDNLNAEMAAQRASLAQEKKIEKEQEKAERRKAELEYEQAVAKKKMDEAQALINAAMAVSMAAVNHWPIPAIPMMALATAVGAAQYAAVKSKHIPKPSYGTGGVIQGKSHRDGGVPILGGRAEVEGGEFIISKVSTTPNVDVLEYINSKRRKLNLDDFIDFYSTGKHKTTFKTVKTQYADGGTLPLLRDDIEIDNRLFDMIDNYSNRPVVVSVVDINDKQRDVRNVQVMAGLE